MQTDRPILVVGAGLGGAAAALGLARAGHAVHLVEQTAELGVIGYGIQLGPNVFRMFRALGVEEAVLRHCHFPPRVTMLDAITAQEVIGVDAGPAFRTRFGDPYVCIHRVDLHGCLLDACRAQPNIAITTSAAFASFDERGDHVAMRCADGRVFEGSALVGADGLGSSVRAHMFGADKPCPIGYVAHRTIVPMDAVPEALRRDDVILWGGPGFHIVQYPLRDRSLFNIVAVFRTEELYARGDVETYRAILMQTYAQAHPLMHAMLRIMNLERRWVIADRDPVRRWSRGRATLLGDAVHPTLQSFAQGAGMSIEDAVVLAGCVGDSGGDVVAAFQRYERQRYLRTARIVLESRALWEFYHLGGLEAEVRDAAARERDRDDIYRCLAWIYDGVPVPALPAA